MMKQPNRKKFNSTDLYPHNHYCNPCILHNISGIPMELTEMKSLKNKY